jgi:ABC-type polysaccharide/polyol phosphate export permease
VGGEEPLVTALAYLRRLAGFRELVAMLVVRDLKVRYKRSLLGMAWTLVNPLLQMGVYTLVFSFVMRVGQPAYPVYLMAGLLPWLLISTANVCSHALMVNQGLIRKVAVPQAVYPLAVVASKLIDVLFSLVPLALMAVLFGRTPGVTWLALVPAFLVATAFTAGLALLFSSLTVFFHDLKHLLDILFQVWFYVTPIFYPARLIAELPHPWLRALLALNPATPIVRLFQDAVYEGRWSSASTVTAAVATATVTLGFGFLTFVRAEPKHILHF